MQIFRSETLLPEDKTKIPLFCATDTHVPEALLKQELS